MHYPTPQDVERIVAEISKQDKTKITIINRGQLEFALEKPRMHVYGHEQYPELYQKAATVMEVLTKSHVLSDGNKRCAMRVAELMISYNGSLLVLPLKAIRLSVDTAMDEEDRMSEEIVQWFKVHTANNSDQLSVMLGEYVEELSRILTLLKSGKINDAEFLANKWLALDSYPERKEEWERLVETYKAGQVNYPKTSNMPRILKCKLLHDFEYLSHPSIREISANAKLSIMDHELEELRFLELVVRKYEDILRTTKDTKILLYKARILEQFGFSMASLDCLKKILTMDPSQHHAHYHIGSTNLLMGNYQEAVESFKKYIESDSSNPDAYANMSLGLQRMGRNHDAVNAINMAIEIKPHSSYFYRRGMFEAEHEDFTDAEKSVRRALEHEPADSGYLAAYTHILIKTGKIDQALSAGQNAVNLNPDSLECISSLASVYAAKKEYNVAIKHYKQILVKDSDNLSALIDVGGSYSNMGKYEKALPYLKRAVSQDPDNAIGLHSIGITLQKTGRYVEAATYLNRGVSVHPDNLVLLISKAVVQTNLGQMNDAVETLKHAIKVNSYLGRLLETIPEFAPLKDLKSAKELFP